MRCVDECAERVCADELFNASMKPGLAKPSSSLDTSFETALFGCKISAMRVRVIRSRFETQMPQEGVFLFP